MEGGRLLLRDGIANAIEERDEESEIDCSRHFRSVFQVQIGKGGQKLLDGLVRKVGGQQQFRLYRHIGL